MALLATLLASLFGCPFGPRLVPAVVGLVADLATFGASGLVYNRVIQINSNFYKAG